MNEGIWTSGAAPAVLPQENAFLVTIGNSDDTLFTTPNTQVVDTQPDDPLVGTDVLRLKGNGRRKIALVIMIAYRLYIINQSIWLSDICRHSIPSNHINPLKGNLGQATAKLVLDPATGKITTDSFFLPCDAFTLIS